MERFYSVKPLDSPSNGDNALFTARYVDSDIKVVIKKCDKELSQTQTEEEITQILKHPNIITCYEVFEIDDYVFFVLEFAPKGNLYEKDFTEDDVRQIIIQLVSALDYCHKRNIIHRDIKPENIVMFRSGLIKLIDFGWACEYDDNDRPTESAGTRIYNSPEMVRGEEYGFSYDVWQVGVLIYELLTQSLPFDGEKNTDIKKNILRCKPDYPKNLSNEVVDLLRRILTKYKEDRIDLQDILRHPWFRY
jgi:serine/threonine protein kinase